MTTAIIVAAGRGKRLGANYDKAFLSIGSKPMVAYSMLAFEASPEVNQIVLVVRRGRQDAARGMAQMFGISKLQEVVVGGAERQDSVRAGLEATGPEAQFITVHDAARPLVTPALIAATIAHARKYGSGVAAQRVVDCIKEASNKGAIVNRTLERTGLWLAQTPQTFEASLLRRAYARLAAEGETVLDEASAVEALGEKVRLVEWQPPNMKVTVSDDLTAVARLLNI